MNKAFGYGFFFGVLIGAGAWLFVGACLGKMELQRVAIEAKVAQYDSQTGEFKYKILEGDDKAKEAK